jgi:hypothetical protein
MSDSLRAPRLHHPAAVPALRPGRAAITALKRIKTKYPEEGNAGLPEMRR